MSGKGGKKFASRGRRREKMWDKMGISWAQEKKRATLPTKFANGHNGKGKFEWADHFQVVGDWFAFITRLLFFFVFCFSPVTIDARNFCFLLLCVFVVSLSETLQLTSDMHTHMYAVSQTRAHAHNNRMNRTKGETTVFPVPGGTRKTKIQDFAIQKQIFSTENHDNNNNSEEDDDKRQTERENNCCAGNGNVRSLFHGLLHDGCTLMKKLGDEHDLYR